MYLKPALISLVFQKWRFVYCCSLYILVRKTSNIFLDISTIAYCIARVAVTF